MEDQMKSKEQLIAELKQLQKQIEAQREAAEKNRSKQSDEHLRLVADVFESTLEGVMVTDAKGTILLVNPAFSMVTGYSPEEVIGKNPRILNSGKHDAEFYVNMWACIHECGHWRGEIWNRRKNGEIYLQLVTISAIKDESGKTLYYAAVFSDITERKRYEEQIKYHAYHDSLTGLPNRLLFHDRLSQALVHANRNRQMVAVLFLDLDRFKVINDSLGHAVGDLLLKAVAERLTGCLREGDTLSRLGGDEFTVIIPDIAEEKDAAKVARKIINALFPPFVLDGHEFFVNTSIGISLYPVDGTDIETLIKNADAAMYRAKERGGNHYQFYTPDMNAKAVEKLAMETDLHRAVDREELTVCYQPLVGSFDGRIVGAEALIRWQHPELGPVSPAEFIPLAEETGLITQIGEWVLRTACKQMKEWQEANLSLDRVCVNLSVRQLRQDELVATVVSALQETGLAPNCLELEISESITLHNLEQIIDTLHNLQMLGVRISIDDFGAGYSSLMYLKKFPIDTIKIDQSLVQDVVTNSDDAAIVAAVIALAHTLKLEVVAEGVENEAQFEFLSSCQCDIIQGYFFSKPLSAKKFEELLRDNNA
ncbi:putative bifunctional diguanylate cyclase/phosphodiesterase [Effusibacillus lacus]|uniref:Diguanylate cyclase n=1 Tax=Effusibacillus lacus TaxID=1348429 RepID=A0A292YDV8_9BACL|nr:EAL domain-containing protein [Effusibacillus lacus]TCS70654.1 PAS domain S-box-containing protein/diguanylate cyclase (GGDEF)-like protein [Effusibacillus lacus]GAX90652.1 diguanylate cyclase [Effusibacillus lacus]